MGHSTPAWREEESNINIVMMRVVHSRKHNPTTFLTQSHYVFTTIAHASFTCSHRSRFLYLFTSSITQSHYVFTTIAHASFTCSHSASQRPTGHTNVHSHSAPATATLKSDYVFTYIIRPFKMQRDTFIFFFWGDQFLRGV
jgi:hypothetical protein